MIDEPRSGCERNPATTTPIPATGTATPSRNDPLSRSGAPSHQAERTIAAILTNSEGCSRRPGRRIQRVDPFAR